MPQDRAKVLPAEKVNIYVSYDWVKALEEARPARLRVFGRPLLEKGHNNQTPIDSAESLCTVSSCYYVCCASYSRQNAPLEGKPLFLTSEVLEVDAVGEHGRGRLRHRENAESAVDHARETLVNRCIIDGHELLAVVFKLMQGDGNTSKGVGYYCTTCRPVLAIV